MEPKPEKIKGIFSAYKIPIAIAAFVVLLLIVVYALDKNHNSSSSKSSKGSNGSTVAATNSTLLIREFGVQIILPTELKNMTYTPVVITSKNKNNIPPMVNLQFGQYSTLANECLGGKANGAHPFATLVKISGKASGASSSSNVETLKQFDTFYVDKLRSSIPDSVKCTDSATKVALDNLSKSLDGDLRTAFSTAQKVN